MLQIRPLGEQLEAASSDPVRTLVVGAGVAGASFAALMRRRGRHPVLIDRAEAGASAGYMLGLLPLAGNLLHTLDRYPQYLEASCPISAYEFGDGRGRIVRRFGFGDFFAANGDYRGIDRGSLIDVVAGDGAVSRRISVASIEQGANAASVAFSDGTTAEFDLVVVADGLHSATRAIVQPQRSLGRYDSKWGGWVVWAPLGEQVPTAYSEYWCPGRFVGFYPVKGRVGIFIGGPEAATVAGPAAFGDSLRRSGSPGKRVEAALDALAADPDPFYWKFTDVRSERLADGRVVLLGDAGIGFMPTAGVGAAMAMDSAAALDDEVSRTGAAQVPFALELYERRQRPRLIAAQRDSRRLARVMFTRSRLALWMVRQVMRAVSLKAALGGIRKVVERR